MNKYASGVAEYRSSEGKTVEVLSPKLPLFLSAPLENASAPVSTTRERIRSRLHHQGTHDFKSAPPGTALWSRVHGNALSDVAACGACSQKDKTNQYTGGVGSQSHDHGNAPFQMMQCVELFLKNEMRKYEGGFRVGGAGVACTHVLGIRVGDNARVLVHA